MTQRLEGKPARGAGSPPRAGAIAGRTGKASRLAAWPPSRWGTVISCLLLALAVWLVFGQTLNHDFLNYDDPDYVIANLQVQSGLN